MANYKKRRIEFEIDGLQVTVFEPRLIIDSEMEDCHGPHDIESTELTWNRIKIDYNLWPNYPFENLTENIQDNIREKIFDLIQIQDQ